MPKNIDPKFFHGPTFEEELEKAIKQHGERVVGSTGKVFWKEPSQHDIMYHYDPARGQKVFMPDGVPCEPGLGEPEPEDIADRVRRQIQSENLARLAREMGADTEEEANDFQVEEGQDLCPYSGHEYSEQDESNDAVAFANNRKQQEEQEREAAIEARRQELISLGFQPAPVDPPPASDKE